MRRTSLIRSRILAACAALLLMVSASPAAAIEEMSKDEIICLSQSGVGFSYWWGHDVWCGGECTPDFSCPPGSCSGGTHSGSYGADCSGFVGKVWQVPNPIALPTPSHPYSTYDFYCLTTHWTRIDRGDLETADALVHRDGCPGESGHVMIFDSGDPWGSLWTYEARGCSYGIVHNNRTADSTYIAIRRNMLAPDCVPAEEVCDGIDNDCDESIDEEYEPFACGTGICESASTCEEGVESCEPGQPEQEVCDGLDNDCDGTVDEDDVCAVPEEEDHPEPDPVFPEGEPAEPGPDAGEPGQADTGVTGGCGCRLAV